MSKNYSRKWDIEKQVKNVISELQTGHGLGLYGALITLRTTLIKSRSALSQLIKLNAVKLLIETLQDTSRHVGHNKIVDIVMSILANLCLEDVVRKQVTDKDTISAIARVTLTSEEESVHNRGVRALANLAQESNHCDTITEMEVPEFVAKRLMETKDEECRITYIRALRLLCRTEKGVKRLVEDTQAVQALAALLKLDQKNVSLKSLRILSEISAVRCCVSFTGQILAANVLEELVKLANDEDNDMGFYSFSLVLRLCEQEQMRPALGAAGVISLLLMHLNSERVFVNKISAMNALCLCTKESNSRTKISDHGGLEVFVSALQGGAGGQYAMLYDRIISSLVNFLYSDDCLSKLLKHGLVTVLMEHLRRCCHLPPREENLRAELYILADAAEIQNEDCDQLSDNSLIQECDKSGQEKNCDILGKEDSANRDTYNFPKSTCDIQLSSDINHVIMPGEEGDEKSQESEKCSARDDPLLIDSSLATDSDGMLVDEMASDESTENTGTIPSVEVSTSRNTFSINSPTYVIENSWKMEDYISGVTCKTFTSDQDCVRITPFALGPNLTPYSPLSTAASYYSPVHSSPSLSVSLSPQSSPSFGSPVPTSTPDPASPSWSRNSSEQHSVRSSQNQSPISSPPWPASYSQFSPLDLPASPLHSYSDQGTVSPVFNSQMSNVSYTGSLAGLTPSLEISPDSPFSAYGSQQTDTADCLGSQDPLLQFSQSSGALQRHETINHDGLVYSASEEEEDSISLPPSQAIDGSFSQQDSSQAVTEEIPASHKETSASQYDDTLSEDKIKGCAGSLFESDSQTEMNQEERPVRDIYVKETHSFSQGSFCSPARKESTGFTIDSSNSKEQYGFDSLSQNDSELQTIMTNTGEVFNKTKRKSGKCQAQDTSKECSEKTGWTRFSPTPPPELQTHHITVQSPCTLPKAGTSYSPCNKPFFCERGKLKHYLALKNSEFQKPNEDISADRQNKHDSNKDKRISKILRITECNILILLSRVSMKQNTTHLLSEEAGVIACLLDYVRLSDRPLKRCCRILHRLCSSSLNFQKLVLLQIPTLLVKMLVLNNDGSFPSVMFCTEWENQFGVVERSKMNISDFHVTSSQSSDDFRSQKSLLGRLLELEFAGDAYSKMSSADHSKHESFSTDHPIWYTDNHPSLSEPCSNDIYEPGCSRVEVRVQLGFRLLHTLSSVALSYFGRGEIDHVLSNPSAQCKLACLVSLVCLIAGCKHGPMRRNFIRHYKLWDHLLPYLFMSEATPAREAIISGISLNLHLESPPKNVLKIPDLEICPDLCDNLTLEDPSTQQKTKRSKNNGSSSTNCVNKKQANGNTCPYKSFDFDLHFVVKSAGQDVTYGVNKEKLISKSSVFSAMLGGSYAESAKSEIIVTEVNSFGFEFMLHYLHGCSTGCPIIDSLRPGNDNHLPSLNTSPSSAGKPDPSQPNPGEKISGSGGTCVRSSSPSRQNIKASADLSGSQDSLGCLSLDDNQQPEVKNDNLAPPHPLLMDIIDKCADILEVADKYLLSDVIRYISSVLSYTCLQPDTCLSIFPLSYFYKLDLLTLDCMRETLLANITCKNAANIYSDLADLGYKEAAKGAMLRLLNNAFKD
ncbi:hypothetical protein Btru_001582 [Bulinus truncatus]|nr:hypothetical protein Btru_001582 [Bulinus truncatus]